MVTAKHRVQEKSKSWNVLRGLTLPLQCHLSTSLCFWSVTTSTQKSHHNTTNKLRVLLFWDCWTQHSSHQQHILPLPSTAYLTMLCGSSSTNINRSIAAYLTSVRSVLFLCKLNQKSSLIKNLTVHLCDWIIKRSKATFIGFGWDLLMWCYVAKNMIAVKFLCELNNTVCFIPFLN